MTDVCNIANQIASYTPSSTVSLLSKNVDAVTVEANLVACNALTIQGIPVTTTSSDKIQNISSATAGVTNFTGEVTMTDLSTDQIETDIIIPKTGTSVTITDAGVVNPTLTVIPSTGRIGVNYTTPQNTIDVRSGSTATTPSFLVDATNSRIGIGTTSLNYPIHVSNPTTSTVALAGFLAPNLPVSANASIFVGTTTSNLAALRYVTSATNTTATNQLALSVGSTNILTSTNSATNIAFPLYANLGSTVMVAWAQTVAVNNFKAENMLNASAAVNANFAPYNYRLDFTALKADGYGTTVNQPLLRVGYGGATTTWSSNYSGAVAAERGGSTTIYEEVTASGIPLFPILTGTSWNSNDEHSGTLTLTYQGAAGGGYIYKWDLSTVVYQPSVSGANMTRGSGYIFNLTALGRPTALGIFFSASDLTTLSLTAQIVSARVF